MKEVKSYFNNGNSLNKGFASTTKDDVPSAMKSRLTTELPPLEVIAEYEAAFPGISAKMLEMLESEQKQRHRMEEIRMQMQHKAYNMGRIFAFLLICIFCYVTMQLAFNVGQQIAATFAVIAFSMLFILALVNRPRREKMAQREERPDHKKSSPRARFNRNRRNR